MTPFIKLLLNFNEYNKPNHLQFYRYDIFSFQIQYYLLTNVLIRTGFNYSQSKSKNAITYIDVIRATHLDILTLDISDLIAHRTVFFFIPKGKHFKQHHPKKYSYNEEIDFCDRTIMQ